MIRDIMIIILASIGLPFGAIMLTTAIAYLPRWVHAEPRSGFALIGVGIALISIIYGSIKSVDALYLMVKKSVLGVNDA